MPATAENDVCFEQPHWPLIEKGYDVERWFADGVGSSTGGMSFPKRVHLPVGHRYYRLASGTAPDESKLGGGWWMSFETYKTIERYAEAHDLDFTYAARLFPALPYDWTRVDRLVSAILSAPMDAYAGEGKVAESGGDKWTPLQHIKVLQLYIPGLVANLKERNLYKRVWRDVEVRYAHNRAVV
jgi:hypothetical protein